MCDKEELIRFWWRSQSRSDFFDFSFFSDSSPLSNYGYCRLSLKIVNGFGWNLVDRLGVWQGWIDLILVKIQIQMWFFFFSDSSPSSNYGYCTISLKVENGFGWNLVERLGVWQGRIDSILVKIPIQMWFFFLVILHHWAIMAIVGYL